MNVIEEWQRPPESLSLRAGEVHVWLADLDVEQSTRRSLIATLSPDERRRARGYRRANDGARFSVSRGVLRQILSVYTGLPPKLVRFVYGPNGKPALADEPGPGDLRFNLSRRGATALVAVARGRDVGIDLEPVDPAFATREVAERFFSPCEIETLGALPEPQQTEAFFQCWTRKEAYLKALGTGLTTPLDSFDVSLAPGAAPAILRACGTAPARWSVHSLEPAPGVVGALAVENGPIRLASWRWARPAPASTDAVLA
jgi:4'-phosphopantetheinyl transferase